jgi:hypothetical protein
VLGVVEDSPYAISSDLSSSTSPKLGHPAKLPLGYSILLVFEMTLIEPAEPAERSAYIQSEKHIAAHDVDEINNDLKYDSDGSSARKQEGVKKVEAVTKVWTKKTLVIMFVL